MAKKSAFRTLEVARLASAQRPARAAGQVQENGTFEPFILYKMHYFTKTGSGQTQGKLKNDAVFSGWAQQTAGENTTPPFSQDS